MNDEELLDRAVEVAQGLATSFNDRLMSGIVLPDLKGWRARGRPLRSELQIRESGIWAVDALEWGALALGERLSVTGISSSRYLAEIAAIMEWLAEPNDYEGRQRRALERHLDALHQETKTIRHIQGRETDPMKRQANERTLGIIEVTSADVLRIASQMKLSPLGKPPRREELFDKYLSDLGGYAFFAMTSMMGSHPGLGLGGMFASVADSPIVSMDRGQLPLQRAYLVMAQMRAFRHIAQVAAETLKLDLRVGEELVHWLQERDNIDPLVSDRFHEATWPRQGVQDNG